MVNLLKKPSQQPWPIMLLLFYHYGGRDDCWEIVEIRQVGVFKDEQANKKQCVESVLKGKNEKATQWDHNLLPAQSLDVFMQ